MLGGLITPIALYLGHKERLKTEESAEGTDSLDIYAFSSMNWVTKKDGTTLWCIKDIEDELPPPQDISLRVKENWSFNLTRPRALTPILPEPSISPSTVDGVSSHSTLIETMLANI